MPKAFIDAGLQLGFHHLDINGFNQTGDTSLTKVMQLPRK